MIYKRLSICFLYYLVNGLIIRLFFHYVGANLLFGVYFILKNKCKNCSCLKDYSYLGEK